MIGLLVLGVVALADDGAEGTAPAAETAPAGEPTVEFDGDSQIPAVTDRSGYDAVVEKRLPLFRSCYEMGLEEHPGMGGRLAFTLAIGTDGKVTKVELKSSTLGSPDVEYCVLDAIGSRTFPTAEKVVEARYLLRFSRK